MKFLIQIMIYIYCLGITLFLGYDFLTYTIERYSHFHMGRWKRIEDWRKSVEKVCTRWVIKTPTLRLKKDCRYLLLDRVTGNYGKKMVQSWQKAGCLLGLDEGKVGLKVHEEVKMQLLTQKGSWKIRPEKIDYAMMSYALLRKESLPHSIRPAMDAMIECIESNLCEDGLVSYSGGKNSIRRYVDTLGFVCPFLGLYGKIYDKPEYIDMAINQIKIFSKIGVYRELPVHCYETSQGLPIGVLGWGRGTGWYGLAMVDLYESVPDGQQKTYLLSQMKALADRIIDFQGEDGGFTAILATQTPYDSSATAMFGYYLAKCGIAFRDDKYRSAAERCVYRLMRETKINGVIDGCQGDTVDIGIFSEMYAEMPFAQGIALRLIRVLNI